MIGVQDRVIKIVSDCFERDANTIKVTDNFIDDLGGVSIDGVHLAIEFDRVFNVFISDEDIEAMKTVQNAIDLITAKLNTGD